MKTNVILLAIISITLADQNPLFPILVETSSISQAAFNGGGVALSNNVSGASLNPATLYAYHKLYGKRLGISGSYQNNLEGKIISGTGISFAPDQQNVLALDYSQRNSREGEAPILHRGVVTYTSLVREEAKEGFMSWGANITYLNSNGSYPTMSKLPISIGDSTSFYETGISTIDGSNQMVSLDIGVYQFDKQRGLAYGLVLENIAGYEWTKRENSIATVHSVITNAPDTTQIPVDTTRFTNIENNESGWINGTTKSLLAGMSINRKILGDRVILIIPFDVRFWGFMDKHLRKNSEWKHRCMMYTGSEINFGGALSLRGGYSWAPYEYLTDELGNPLFRNHHQASGGFRISLSVVDIEMAFKKGELGGGLSVYF